MRRQHSNKGKVTRDLDSGLRVCIIEQFDDVASKVYVNPSEGLTVNDLYQECLPDDRVFGVVYLEELDYEDLDTTKDELLELNRKERYYHLFHSDIRTMSLPESHLKLQERI